VAVRPEDQPAGRVERDRGADLLAAVHDATVDEVAHGPCFRRGKPGRAPIEVARRVRARAAAAAPVVVVVAVEIGPDGGAARRGLAILAPEVIAAAGDVVFAAVGIDVEDDTDLA